MLTSCSNEGVSFGTVEYYPSFLWVSEKTTTVVKKMQFDYSEDAIADPEVFAEFQFVDNEGKPVDDRIMVVMIDGGVINANKFKISNDVKEKTIIFSFSPDADAGKYQGYLRLVSHKLDRVDSLSLENGQSADVFQWTIEYNKVMNPLAKVLMWFLICFLICLFVWFVFIRPIMYPHFKKFNKSILIELDGKIVGQMNFSFNGARRVVFSDKKVIQSIWEKVFIGETKTFINQYFRTPLIFTPDKKNAKAYGLGYVVKNPIPKSGVSIITNIQQKLKITLR